MEKKQNSVEWLIRIVQSCIAPNYIPQEIIKQAKAMHKEEIVDAWIIGCDNGYDKAFDNITWKEMDTARDNYYTKTFGGNNE